MGRRECSWFWNLIYQLQSSNSKLVVREVQSSDMIMKGTEKKLYDNWNEIW